MHLQMGKMVQLKDMGLFKSQGLIGDKWTDAEDGRTLPVCTMPFAVVVNDLSQLFPTIFCYHSLLQCRDEFLMYIF